MTYFIEQYVTAYTKTTSSTLPLPLSYLDKTVTDTAKSTALKTVAIFKIKFKK